MLFERIVPLSLMECCGLSPVRVHHICMHLCDVWISKSTSVSVCRLRVNGLTDDDGGDLVPAGSMLILDLTGEGGVDGIVHLSHCKLVAVHHHCLW